MRVVRAPWPLWAAWRRAPRRLKATRAGVLVLLAAVALGLVAIFSGNNPLFFLWGVVLGGIVVSGVLSEATLRPLEVKVEFARPLRAGEPLCLWLHIANKSRFLPALAVTWRVQLVDAEGPLVPLQSYVLRLGGKERVRLALTALARCRGALAVHSLSAHTAFPFGLFVKERPFFHAVPPAMVRPARKRCAPLSVGTVSRATLVGRARTAHGDDVAQLRNFRPGDGWRRVLWRRVASTGRWLVAEFDGEHTGHVVLEVRADGLRQSAGAAGAATEAAERLLSYAGSLAEDLAATSASVGLWTHGASVAGEPGPLQAGRLLDALARVDVRAAVGPRPPSDGQVVDVAALWRQATLREAAEPSAVPAARGRP